MQIEVIDNHSVAVNLLTGGQVLDAGARGFEFSKWFAMRGHRVYAQDPSPDISDPCIENMVFVNSALVAFKNRFNVRLDKTGDPGAWFVSESGFPVPCQTTPDLARHQWDVIKLNIEGSEYDILDEWPGPIARQVVVSFHEHTPRARGRADCDRLIAKMSEWYKAFNVVWEKRYCCAENYWDLLFIRNDLV
jgi:hypothetical protein